MIDDGKPDNEDVLRKRSGGRWKRKSEMRYWKRKEGVTDKKGRKQQNFCGLSMPEKILLYTAK